jgi:predicted phage-related endonuclease
MGVPDEVQAQVQWQMLITDAPWCDVVALLGGLKFEVTRVERDRKYQALLFLKCEEWRQRHIIDDVAPAVVGEDSAIYAEVVPQTNDEWTQADGGLERIASLYSEKVYEAKLLDTEIADLAMQIKEAIGDRQGVIGAGWSATWRQNKSGRKVDWSRLAAEQAISADTVNAYTLETPGARVFKFKQEAQGE